MTNATAAVDGLQTLEMALQLTAKVTFSDELHGLNALHDLRKLFVA
jgi:hypothetical protein